MSIQQLNYKINITKILYSLIFERNEQFIDFLQQDGMKDTYDELLDMLFSESCKILDMPITLQLDWVEQKCFEIRKSACESKICLKELTELTA